MLTTEEINSSLKRAVVSARLDRVNRRDAITMRLITSLLFSCDTIVKGMIFCTVKRIIISGMLRVGMIEVSHLCRGGTPILNIIRSVMTKLRSVGIIIAITKSREALLWQTKYFKLLVAELADFRAIKIGMKHSIFNSSRAH